MKIALIYNRGQRVAVGERCEQVLRKYIALDVDQFDLDEVQTVKGGYDLYLRLEDGDHSRSVPKGLHPYAWWVADTSSPYSLSCILKNAKACDHLFCFQKEGASKVANVLGREVSWLPPAVDHFSIRPQFVPFRERKWDVAFVGTAEKHNLRKVVLETIRSEYPNSFVGPASHEELFSIYSRSRIVVNYVMDNNINTRIFEAMGSGAMVLNSPIIDNGFKDLFEPGLDCDTFVDPTTNDLKKKVDHYLAHPYEMSAIARLGFEVVHNRHTYKHRVGEIFRVVGMGEIF